MQAVNIGRPLTPLIHPLNTARPALRAHRCYGQGSGHCSAAVAPAAAQAQQLLGEAIMLLDLVDVCDVVL
jgi:hypothetical protein